MTAPLQVPPQGTPVLNADGTMHHAYRKLLVGFLERLGGYGGAVQTQDDILDALAALADTAGLLVQTGAGTAALRSIAGTAPVTVTNGDGASGNPTVSLANSGVTAGTYAPPASITVDAKGRITSIS